MPLRSQQSPPAGYRTLPDVNICHYQHLTLRPTAGRFGPGEEFPVVKTLGRAGKRIGLHSVPNPQIENTDRFQHDPDPPPLQEGMRDSQGRLWRPGYSKTGGKVAWWLMDDLEPDKTPDVWGFGPVPGAKLDYPALFREGRWILGARPRPKKRGRVLGSPRDFRVRVTGNWRTFRWGVRSTTRSYVGVGDELHVLWHAFGFYFVEVVRSVHGATPEGTRGFVIAFGVKKIDA